MYVLLQSFDTNMFHFVEMQQEYKTSVRLENSVQSSGNSESQ